MVSGLDVQTGHARPVGVVVHRSVRRQYYEKHRQQRDRNIKERRHNMPSLWDDIKKTVKEGVAVAAEKTEELRKIGKVKIDIINVKRALDKNYKDLGMAVHEHISSGKKTAVNQSAQVKELVGAIDESLESLKQKEEEIERIKQEAAEKKSGNADSSTPSTKTKKAK